MPMLHIQIEPPPTHQAALRILKNRSTGKMFVGKMQKSSAKKWCDAATMMMRMAAAEQKMSTYDTPVIVDIVFVYPHTQESRKLALKKGVEVVNKSTRPDLDNLSKSVLDSLVNAGCLKDDGLVVELTLRKVHAETPMVVVDITDAVD